MAEIILKKNLNNKLGNEFMIHVGKPSTKPIVPATFEAIITFTAPGLSVNYKLFDYVLQRLDRIPIHIRMSSHGFMEKDAFLQMMYEEHQVHGPDDAAIYYFELVK